MATVDECRVALRKLADQFDEIDQESRSRHVVERTISCHIRDLGITFYGRLRHGGLGPFDDSPPADGKPAEVKLTIGSDDLVSLVNGELDMGRAVFGGRVKIDASFGDLLRLRKLL
ncbi:SCP2 sterol-binding domain-containing protein [Streptosporangium sp. NBC_01756]|uniref:SCP2 sterol-binding domain-containing protein n=1 Tax=Streptosporangium sp. NBC_01756 TaxID=2975950 RepID=UPI002DD7CDB3|nr:SCP2 sterol-binding domain-containing protein [Streptosporangium sp. NBC_01756]WSC87208.1 SCP2 sterol-binding domain-containing protein [Streptosporangium sp. NBC_01756]